MPSDRDLQFMAVALEEARAAAAEGEVPVGCVIVDDATNRIVARARNAREKSQDPTAHAELVALREASSAKGTFRLEGVTLYATLEPCPMCAGAIVNARVPRVIYGCADPKAGALHTMFGIGLDARLNHTFIAEGGVLGEECAQELKSFFASLRAQGKNGK
jgi:tRNA(adenine34) deaminase